MKKRERMYDILYQKPQVQLIHDTGIGSAELAARTAYDSFEQSENNDISYFKHLVKNGDPELNVEETLYNVTQDLQNIYHSDLLDKLAWTYFHHSVLEHAVLTYYIDGISRGVLQELARHRIASYTVRSTRYTMNDIINAYNASLFHPESEKWFINKCISFDMLVIADEAFQIFEWQSVYKKLDRQYLLMEFSRWEKITIPKGNEIDFWKPNDPEKVFNHLQSLPKKRNIGDPFKHIVSDNWKVDLVMTINLRSLKNFFDLRDSGSAWFQIRWLAEEMKIKTPKKYLKLIDKKYKN